MFWSFQNFICHKRSTPEMETSHVILGLIILLVLAVTVALIAFVVIPALDDSGKKKNSYEESMDKVVEKINKATRSGYDYDMMQDDDIEDMKKDIETSTESIDDLKQQFEDLQQSSSDLAGLSTYSAASVEEDAGESGNGWVRGRRGGEAEGADEGDTTAEGADEGDTTAEGAAEGGAGVGI